MAGSMSTRKWAGRLVGESYCSHMVRAYGERVSNGCQV